VIDACLLYFNSNRDIPRQHSREGLRLPDGDLASQVNHERDRAAAVFFSRTISISWRPTRMLQFKRSPAVIKFRLTHYNIASRAGRSIRDHAVV
jgi:hypothetical protein